MFLSLGFGEYLKKTVQFIYLAAALAELAVADGDAVHFELPVAFSGHGGVGEFALVVFRVGAAKDDLLKDFTFIMASAESNLRILPLHRTLRQGLC